MAKEKICEYCDSCQLCEGNKEKVTKICGNTFSFRDTDIDKDSLFLTEEEWNSLVDFIYEAYCLHDWFNSTKTEFSQYTNDGEYESSGEDFEGDIRAGARYNNGRNAFMTAHMANGLFAKMKYFQTEDNELSRNEAVYGGSNGSIITASYFNELADYANKLTIECSYCDSGQYSDTCETCQSTCELSAQNSGGSGGSGSSSGGCSQWSWD